MDDRCQLEDSSSQGSDVLDLGQPSPGSKRPYACGRLIYQVLQVQMKALRRDTTVSVGDDSYLLNSAIKKYC